MDTCEICKLQAQTLIHLLIHCQTVQTIWHWIKDCLQITNVTEWDDWRVMTNQVHPKPKHNCNLVVLAVKWLIFARKCQNTPTNAKDVKVFLRDLYEVELYIAISEGKESLCTERWKPVLDSILNNG